MKDDTPPDRNELIQQLYNSFGSSGIETGLVEYFMNPQNIAKLSDDDLQSFVEKLSELGTDIEAIKALVESRDSWAKEKRTDMKSKISQRIQEEAEKLKNK